MADPGTSTTLRDLGIGILVITGFMLAFVIIMFLVGWTNSIKPVCPVGYRAISVDGSKSITGVNLVTPDADFPTCSPALSCPVAGQQWAVHPDGSALTNSCAEPNCPCTIFQHCPAYSSTLFRQFGEDERISLFQVIDPLVKDPTHPQDPYDPPYLLLPGSGDSCFLNSTTINMVWPPLKLGDRCLRGTLGKIENNPSQYVCAPSSYVEKTTAGDFIFRIESYMSAYRT